VDHLNATGGQGLGAFARNSGVGVLICENHARNSSLGNGLGAGGGAAGVVTGFERYIECGTAGGVGTEELLRLINGRSFGMGLPSATVAAQPKHTAVVSN